MPNNLIPYIYLTMRNQVLYIVAKARKELNYIVAKARKELNCAKVDVFFQNRKTESVSTWKKHLDLVSHPKHLCCHILHCSSQALNMFMGNQTKTSHTLFPQFQLWIFPIPLLSLSFFLPLLQPKFGSSWNSLACTSQHPLANLFFIFQSYSRPWASFQLYFQ